MVLRLRHLAGLAPCHIRVKLPLNLLQRVQPVLPVDPVVPFEHRVGLNLLRMVLAVLLIGAIIATAFSFFTLYNSSSYQAKYMGIGSYGAQWDDAMAWVRNNTPIKFYFCSLVGLWI